MTKFEEFENVIARLRAPDGCPWDRAQTHMSLKKTCIEEAAEVICGINILDQTGDADNLKEELGDLLMQVVLHARIAEEEGLFTMDDVIQSIIDKMIRRHPHVFAQAQAETSEDVLRNWEAIKKDEKSLRTQTEVMRDVPRTFPALMRAAKVQKKARDVGFDWDEAREALIEAQRRTEGMYIEESMEET